MILCLLCPFLYGDMHRRRLFCPQMLFSECFYQPSDVVRIGTTAATNDRSTEICNLHHLVRKIIHIFQKYEPVLYDLRITCIWKHGYIFTAQAAYLLDDIIHMPRTDTTV